MRKPAFLHMLKQRPRSSMCNHDLISTFVYRYVDSQELLEIIENLYFLHPKFQASSHLLWLDNPFYVRPGRTPQTDFLMTQLIWSTVYTVMTLSFWTDRSRQTVQNQIRLLLDQVFTVCYSIGIFMTIYPKVWAFCWNFR